MGFFNPQSKNGRSHTPLCPQHLYILHGIIFALLHFSNTTGVFEKWRPIPKPHAGCFSTTC